MRVLLPICWVIPVIAFAPTLPGLLAQTPPPGTAVSSRISRDSLDGITVRGRTLAAYDKAAWHGTDAVMALGPNRDESNLYLARRRPDNGRWEVVFGRLTESLDTMLIAYRAVQDSGSDTLFSAMRLSPAEPDTGYYVRAARALNVAREDFPEPNRPYNAMVVPATASEEWFVYLVPAPIRWGYWPLGADTRYTVSADGRTILGRHRMHNAIIETGPPAANQVADFHTAVVADVVEDTDVFYVLTRTPHRSEYVGSDSYVFRIDTSGEITAWDRSKLGM